MKKCIKGTKEIVKRLHACFVKKSKKLLKYNFNWKVFLMVLAQLGTFTTAVIALFALKESIKQRESMYKPELFVEETYLCVQKAESSKFRYFQVDKDSLKLRNEIVFPYYNVINVGFGAALSANLFWLIDDSVMNMNLRAMGITESKIVKNGSFDIVYLRNDSLEYLNDGVVAGWKINYVMPYRSGEKNEKGYYETIISNAISKLLFWGAEMGNDRNTRLEIPATLKYKDINEKWYTKRYKMSIDILKRIDDNNLIFRVYPALPVEELTKEFSGMGDVCHKGE